MKINLRYMGVSVFLSVLLSAQVTFATTYTVDIFTDDNDAVPGDDNCSGGPGGCSLRGAIEEANAHAGDDIIMLPAGTFVLNNVGAGEDSAASGDLDITSNVSIYGAGADQTIIDGNASDRIFSIFPATDPIVNIGHLSVINGNPASLGNDGGAFYIAGGTVTLESLSIRDNQSGDGFFFFGPAAAGCGGAITAANTTLVIRNSTLSGNRTGHGYNGLDGFNPARPGSISGHGGALCVSSGHVVIVDSTIVGNATGDGGSGGSNPVGFGANGSNAGSGGALYLFGTADVSLNNVTIAQNQAGQGGAGGIGATGNGVSGEDGDGGGIYISDIVPGTALNISNTIIAGNSIEASGEGPDCFGLLTSAHHSLIQDPNECDAYVVGENSNLSADPLFDAAGLFDNGGKTQTIALQVASPAVNAGDADTCESLDQRGVPRSGTCDLGSFEYEAFCGDAVLQSPEECDDGNDDEADACDNSCLIIEPVSSGSVDDVVDETSAASSGGGCSLSINSSQVSENTAFAVLSALFSIAYLTRRRCVS